MRNSVLVYSDQIEVSKVLKKTSDFLLSRGFFDFTYISCTDFEESLDILTKVKEKSETSVVICDNSKVDEMIESVKAEGDEFELLFEQAVVLKNEKQKILFLPIELPAEKFLESLGEKELFVCSVFGKSLSNVKTNFENFKLRLGLSYKIITKTQFLHTIYFSKQIVEDELKSAFGDGLYSFKNEDLASACKRVLGEKGFSICTLENVTAGELSARLKGTNIKESQLLLKEEAFKKVGLTDEFLAEKGLVSKETAFALAKNAIKNTESDIALVVLGNLEANSRSYVAIGNKEVIHVFSSLFEGEGVLENIIDFALFRLLRFL